MRNSSDPRRDSSKPALVSWNGQFSLRGRWQRGCDSYEIEGLEKGFGSPIVIDSVHLSDKDFRIIGKVGTAVFIEPALKEFPVCSFLEAFRWLFRKLSGYLAPEVYDRDAGELMEDIVFDVVIKSPFVDIQLWMTGDDLIWGLPLPGKGNNDLGKGFCLRDAQVYAQPGIHKSRAVIHLCILGAVFIFFNLQWNHFG